MKALARHPALHPSEIRRFADWAAEASAATDSYLLEALGAAETNLAGRLFAQRKAQERKENKGPVHSRTLKR